MRRSLGFNSSVRPTLHQREELYNKRIGDNYDNLFQVKIESQRTVQAKHLEGLDKTLDVFINGDFERLEKGNYLSLEQRQINPQAAIDPEIIPATRTDNA